MKLTVQQVWDATLVLAQIIREARPMPQRGKFRLARLHAKLLPEFTTIDAQRDFLIKMHGVRQTTSDVDPVTGQTTITEAEGWTVPADHMPDFTAAWRTIADAEIDVDVQPIPLADLDAGGNGQIEANELITLGELIAE